MSAIITFVGNLFTTAPFLAIVLSLFFGFLIGKIPFGSFRLGGVAGSLIAGVVLSLFGVTIDDTTKSMLFALFIFAVGYESGPQFFRSLGKKTLREVLLALLIATTGLATIIVTCRAFGFDPGLSAGIAAGGMTQSAIMGVASDALTRLNLTAAQLKDYQANIGVGYAVTYIFGSFGTIIICANILPLFMRQKMNVAAHEAEVESHQKIALATGESYALRKLIGRAFVLSNNKYEDVVSLEAAGKTQPITVEKVKRGGAFLDINPALRLMDGDEILVVGQRDAIAAISGDIGTEIKTSDDMQLVMKTQEVVVAKEEMAKIRFKDLGSNMKEQIRHGVFVIGVSRGGRAINMTDDGSLKHGDILTVYGSQADVKAATQGIGTALVPSNVTDLIMTGLGLAVGLLIGMLTLNISGVPLTLGSGGGALLAGLFFGWLKKKRPALGGTLPSAAAEFMKEYGLAAFVAVVGLNSGKLAIQTIQKQGLSIFAAGLIVTIVPLILCMILGRFVLRYKNAAIFAGALSGARSANPAFGQVLTMAGNATPTVPFAITYALANVFLTLLGPFVVALMK